jgi:uncharacterized membrane protein (UPF0127 family)
VQKGSFQLTSDTKLIVNVTRGKALCVGVMADRPLRRMRGLIGRSGLPSGEGLLVRPAPSIHTAFMRFPIDALFLDRDLRVLRIVECLDPWRIASKRRARAVLELAAGESARLGVAVGDELALRERMATVDTGTAPVFTDRSMEAAVGPMRPTRPMSVLAISRDRRFRAVVAMLLARRGCLVTTTPSASHGTELLADQRPDVVVIDAGGVPAEAARTLSMLEELAQPVGVVVVDDEAAATLDGVTDGPAVYAKWGPFDELFTAIEAAERARPEMEGERERA